MKIQVIVTCAANKTVDIPEELQFGKLPTLSVDESVIEWIKRLKSTNVNLVKMIDLYKGGYWGIVKDINSNSKVDNVWILSAGYGIVNANQEVKPYAIALKDNSFDIIHSNATIEHVGSDKMQLKFISECLRVSRKFVFITTPNKYFPIEFHTKIPFIHWLPHNYFNIILKLFGDNFFRHKKNLNLISHKKIISFCEKLKIKNYKIFFNYFLFLKSNIILVIKK